jgi:hypothetical protein
VLCVYVGYEAIRDLTHPTGGHALANARGVLALESWARINVELTVQHLVLPHLWLVDVANAYYGTVYAVSTLLALIWAYRSAPRRYRVWRNALAFTTLLGLVGFYVFPLAPPRLLDALSGGHGFGYVDTLASVPGPWSSSSPLLSGVSNQFAAMPSLHCAWAVWVACVVCALHPRLWVRRGIWLLPAATVFVVIVTGNHFVLDVIAGAFVATLGISAALGLDRARARGARASAGTSLATAVAARAGSKAPSHPLLRSHPDDSQETRAPFGSRRGSGQT